MSARSDVLAALWHGRDPFEHFSAAEHPTDHQGWNSDHLYLAQAIDERRPRIVVEVGVWKGGSVKTMASRASALELDCVVIAVDTWLGSTEHWVDPELHAQMRMLDGYPRLYHTFASNIFDLGLQDYVVPLPLDSINALHLLRSRGIAPEVIHIDAGHDYQSASSDLAGWWPILPAGGILIGDDYYTDGITWQGVRQAFDDFFAHTSHVAFEANAGKCIVRKPG